MRHRATPPAKRWSSRPANPAEFSGSREREFLFARHILAGLAVRAAGIAGLRAVPERIVDDRPDGARAAAAFGAATEAVIDLLGAPWKIVLRRADGQADILVADDVAGTDDHESAKGPR